MAHDPFNYSRDGASMNKLRFGFNAMLSICVAFVTGSCAVNGSKPAAPAAQQALQANTTASTTDAIPASEPIVVGKFDVLKDGKQVMISWVGTGEFSVLILPDGESRFLVRETDSQGWFAWKLKPGRYTLGAVKTGNGSHLQTVGIGARFRVKEEDQS